MTKLNANSCIGTASKIDDPKCYLKIKWPDIFEKAETNEFQNVTDHMY